MPRRGLPDKQKMAIRLRIFIIFVALFLGVSGARAASFADLLFQFELREYVKFVLFESAPTRAGRGDVAPAYVNARNLRRIGYRGRIVIVLPGVNDSAVMRELSPAYRLGDAKSETSIVTIEDDIEILRDFEPFPKPVLPPPDLAFRFALRPSEIYNGGVIRGAKVSFHYGVNNLNEIPGNEWSRNKLVFADGRSVLLPSIGFGSNNLGVYANPYAREVGELDAVTARHALITRLIRDRDLYVATVAKGANERIGTMAERNTRLARFFTEAPPGFFSRTTMATLYGAGDPSVWPEVMDYLESLPSNRGTILWSPSVFGQDSQTKMAAMARDHLSAGKRIVFVPVSDPGALTREIPAGEIRVIITDNFPHATYLHLSALSNFPNLVAGDNAVADMMAMGKPFVMTNVAWNIPSMNGLKAFLESTAESETSLLDAKAKGVLIDLFTAGKKGRLQTAAKLADPEYAKFFREAAKKISEIDILKSSLLIVNQSKNVMDRMPELTADAWASLKKSAHVATDPRLDRMAKWMEDEQTLNITGLYKSGVFDSELDHIYSATDRAIFRLPYFWVPVDSPKIHLALAEGIPPALHDFYFQVHGGKPCFRFLAHPTGYANYAEIFAGTATAVPAGKSSLVFVPGASERSGWLVDLDHPTANFQFAKVSIPKRINDSNRTVKPAEVERSVAMTNWIRRSEAENPSHTLTVMAEPLGAYVTGESSTAGGFLVREINDLPEYSREMGVMSFLGEDAVTGEPFFFRFLSESDRVDPWPWFEKNIVAPVSAIIPDWHTGRGITFEMHSQNLVIEIGRAKAKPTFRFVYRDLGGVLPDLKKIMADHIPLTVPAREAEFRTLYQTYFSESLQSDSIEKFVKRQVTDLFAIQFKKYGLIGAERREEIKRLAEDELKRALAGTGAEAHSWAELGASTEQTWISRMKGSSDFIHAPAPTFQNGTDGVFFFTSRDEGAARSTLRPKSGPWRRLEWILDADDRVLGYRLLECDELLGPPANGKQSRRLPPRGNPLVLAGAAR
jgi:hypothetical protein